MANKVIMHPNGEWEKRTSPDNKWDLSDLPNSIQFIPQDEQRSLLLSPQFISFPILNTNVKIPVNDPTKTIEQAYEKGADFLADLLEIDGVKEVLEKHGVEITPL